MPGEEVSVRELRQNLSVHLRRVRDGETLAVTSRGRRVAILAPLGGGSRVDRLIAEGRVTPPSEPWVDPAPAPAVQPESSPSAALERMRDEHES